MILHLNIKHGFRNSKIFVVFCEKALCLNDEIRFQTFGDLFTRCPLAIQTQHPGFYYQESAYQSMARKQIAQSTCRRVEEANFDPSEFLKATEFYGQRPWRQHHQSK